MKAFSLTPEQVGKNYDEFYKIIEKMFPSRSSLLRKMYDDFGDSLALAPASGTEHFHNAIPGGYLDHVLRVLDFSFKVYSLWKENDIPVDDFSVEELAFVAIHHDLGKLGFPGEGNERYVFNESEWHRTNMGKQYDANPEIPFVLVQDLSLFMLQHYGVQLSLNETFGIKLHDGVYEESNKPYLVSHAHKSSLRTYLPLIVHQADMMAAKFEYERWAATSGKALKKFNI